MSSARKTIWHLRPRQFVAGHTDPAVLMCTAGTVPGGLYISQVFAACLYADLTQQLGNPHTGSDERRDHNGKRMSRTLYALAMGMFGGPMGFSVIYFTCEIPEGQPVNRDTLYELINRERDEKHKTGNVIAWSKIETE